jgi:hypothetical protein
VYTSGPTQDIRFSFLCNGKIYRYGTGVIYIYTTGTEYTKTSMGGFGTDIYAAVVMDSFLYIKSQIADFFTIMKIPVSEFESGYFSSSTIVDVGRFECNVRKTGLFVVDGYLHTVAEGFHSHIVRISPSGDTVSQQNQTSSNIPVLFVYNSNLIVGNENMFLTAVNSYHGPVRIEFTPPNALNFIDLVINPITNQMIMLVNGLDTTIALSSYFSTVPPVIPTENVFTMEMTTSELFHCFKFNEETTQWEFDKFLTSDSTHVLPNNVTKSSLMTMFLDPNGKNLMERYLQYIVEKLLTNTIPNAYRLFSSTNTVWQELFDLSDFVVGKYNLHHGISDAIVSTIKLYNNDVFEENMASIIDSTIQWKLMIIPPQSQTTRWNGFNSVSANQQNPSAAILPFVTNLRIKIVEAHTPLIYNQLDPALNVPTLTSNYEYAPPTSVFQQVPGTYTPYVDSSIETGGFSVGRF